MKGGSSNASTAAARLRAAAVDAREAEDRGDGWSANEAWRRYRLISDTQRDPNELIAEGLELSRLAISLADGR